MLNNSKETAREAIIRKIKKTRLNKCMMPPIGCLYLTLYQIGVLLSRKSLKRVRSISHFWR